MTTMSTSTRIDVNKPLWDQSTFYGRFRHFAWMTNPLNAFHSHMELNKAKTLVEDYKLGKEPPFTTNEEVKRAMKLYRSSFHPDTGEIQNVFGRMNFQVPGGMMITGAMLQFYKTVPQVVFWQWANQSFNALVNYTNRNANSPTTTTQLCVAYTTATLSALGTAVGLKRFLETRASPVFQRFVPFAAVAASNFVNIPLMRQNEIFDGINLTDENGSVVCQSRYASIKGIGQVVISRIIMAAPGMIILPIIMRTLETKPWFAKRPFLHAPFQIAGVGTCLLLMVPLACALYPQNVTITANDLQRFDPKAYEYAMLNRKVVPDKLYFNKGL